MNIKHLRYFLSIYELKSLTKAAKSIGVTQSTISKNIQKLEEQLELLLFDRHTREVIPTEAAKQLYKSALLCVSATEELVKKARYLSHGESGTLNIGCGPLVHELLLKPLITEILEQNSDIRVHANTGKFDELKQGLDNHSYECLLYDTGELERIADPSEYQVIPLLQKPVYLVAHKNHPIHQQQNTLQHLFNFKWVLPPIPQRYIGTLPVEFQQFLLRSDKPDFEVTDLPQAIELAEKNNLITIAVGDLNEERWSQRELKAIKIPFSITSDIGFWRIRSRNLTPTLKELINMLQAICDK